MRKTLLALLCVSNLMLSHGQTFDVDGDYKISGNVGIGTSTPLGAIHVSKLGADAWVYFQNNLNGPNNPATNYGLSFGWNYSANNGESIINYNTAIGSRPRLSFTSFDGTNLNEEVTIENGRLGVGINSPNAKLDVYTDLPTQDDYASQYWSTSNANYSLRLQTRWDSEGITHQFIQKFSGVDYTQLSFFKGKVGIGTELPDAKLSVKGDIHAQEVKVDLQGAVAPDFVFEDGYELIKLEEVADYIKKNKHLPDIPAAKEIETNGLELGKMELKLLQKIEELTLYLIDFKSEMEDLKKENKKLKAELEKLKAVGKPE